MRTRAEQVGLPVLTLSAGLTLEDTPASGHAVTVLGSRDIDLSPHRSRLLNADLVTASDVIFGMTGRHAREAAVLDMDSAHRIYTLREFVRRVGLDRPRDPDESVDQYLTRLHSRRPLAQLGSGGPNDDVDDPYGRRKSVYKKTAGFLEGLVDDALDGLFPNRPVG